MKRKHVALLITLGLPALVLGMGFGAGIASDGKGPGEVGVVEGRLRDCPDKPNCVCSEGANPNIEALALEGEPQAEFAKLLDFLRTQEGFEVVSAESNYAHATFRSGFFHFMDDLELRLDPAAKFVHVRSASRVGHSDMGANAKRVQWLRESWNAQ